MLREEAGLWIDTLAAFPATFEAFEDLFLARYWSQSTQWNFKISVMQSSYREEQETKRAYVTRKAAALKLCSPPVSDEEIIHLLTRHFSAFTQALIKTASLKNLNEFFELMGNLDESYE